MSLVFLKTTNGQGEAGAFAWDQLTITGTGGRDHTSVVWNGKMIMFGGIV